MTQVHVVCGALFKPNGEVLLYQQAPHKPAPGTWGVPGGKVEKGEHEVAALERELYEELGVSFERHAARHVATSLHDYGNYEVNLRMYVVDAWRGAAKPMEGQTIVWASPEHLNSLHAKHLIMPADIPFLGALRYEQLRRAPC